MKRAKKQKFDCNKTFDTRLSIATTFFAAMIVILILRLWFLQVVNYEYYKQLAEENRLKIEKTPALRGKIFDRTGEVLASNRYSFAIFIDKEHINDEELFEKLSQVLETSSSVLMDRAKKAFYRYGGKVIIEKDVPFEKISYLRERKEDFKGIEIDYLAIREYPKMTLAAHTIGYVGEVSDEQLKNASYKGVERGDIVGKTGIERAYDYLLRGEKGQAIYEVDALGNIRRLIDRTPAKSGNNIYLTLDARVQKRAEEAIEKAIERARKLGYKNAKAGAAVVLEVKTGRIMAIASYPSYDPNLFVTGIDPETWKLLSSAKSGYPLLNRATKSAYPPGSTFKPLTLISAFENGLVSSGEIFLCSGKWYGFGKDWPKSCWKRSGHGNIGLVRSISGSCDTVYYELGYRLYKKKGEPLQKTAREFGFGRKTGIPTGEIAGRVPDKEWKKNYFKKKELQIWLPGDTVNMAIGQGDMLATPLQIARFYAAIANGGIFYKPQLVEKVTRADGSIFRKFEPEVDFKVKVDRRALSIIRRGLREVIVSGTARYAFSEFPVEVAGKTGTSQVFGKDDFSWFVGYAPYDNPQYVVCVLVEEGGHGGEVAAPAVRYIMAGLFGVKEEELVKAADTSR